MSQEAFEETVKWVHENAMNNTTAEKLKAYGLYKQATEGDVNTSRPGMLDMTGKAKWDAWKANEGKPMEDAKQEYVDEVKAQREKYGQ
mmetsp:Transcript_132353/g.264004  ORF Transcript_132353/g.264004 Transcript_132353/m.264004 type:complete len:88 (-) Transcript_132353:74-337(-)|eukprot:CAMPEP_0172713824 /NCGR_PEP_ID=MMETSP1074-20121228/63804_1 /TAXON_ID=2916 /ORGANISM="Ceratium fusus, Strain PA161109" /LENGTH=87 /DNA_ID=CAMNT_0013538043 /DNA_START=97 /DNA_END=360 /DNA_ORIENTATION=+